MTTPDPTPATPAPVCLHEWSDDMGGIYCWLCGAFVPDMQIEFPDDDESTAGHSLECTCETCLQDHPEREYLIGDDND